VAFLVNYFLTLFQKYNKSNANNVKNMIKKNGLGNESIKTIDINAAILNKHEMIKYIILLLIIFLTPLSLF